MKLEFIISLILGHSNGASASSNSHPLPPSANDISDILEDVWKFYLTYAFDNQLACMITPEETLYGGEEAAAESYYDVSNFAKLSQYKGNPDVALPYIINILNRIQPKTTANLAARIGLLLDVDMADNIELVQFVNETANSKGIFGEADLGFANPQIMSVLLRISSIIPKTKDLVYETFQGFVSSYRTHLSTVLTQYGSFAANSILQTLSLGPSIYDDLLNPLFDSCNQALKNHDSIILEACALHGLLLFDQPVDTQLITRQWRMYQQQWGIGGFRYYYNQPWYPTNVTSHIVEDCLLLVKKLSQ